MALLAPLGGEARRFVLDPWVQHSAWLKLQTVYESRWMRDSAAWARWVPSPGVEARRVALAVAEGKLDELDLGCAVMPFPKAGGRLRHFVRPTLDAEYATLLLGVLLCPLLDARMWSFSFGGRWYSGMARLPAEGDTWRFREIPFSLADRQLFTTYRRSFGLFRRAANWTARRMLGDDPHTNATAAPTLLPQDYPPSALPYLSLPQHRLAGSGPPGSLWHARLDFATAYPCVRRATLRARLQALLAQSLDDVREGQATAWGLGPDVPGSGRPFRAGDVWNQIEQGGLGRELADRLLDLVDAVRYVDDGGQVGDAWRPSWGKKTGGWPALPGLGDDSEGLPTGLSVSSVLFNTYLHEMDEALVAGMGLRGHGPIAGAVFRYVDDLLVLAPSTDAAVDLLDTAVRWLDKDRTGTNLAPSYDKVTPVVVGEAMRPKVGPTTAGTRLPDRAWVPLAKRRWAAVPGSGRVDLTSLDSLVTTVVEQMSALGNPDLADLWGAGVGPRLAELHRLVRVDVEDTEVREDTRLAFAAHRLVSAPLPPHLENAEATGGDAALTEIQRSLLHALRKAPWKPSLWRDAARFVVRLAGWDDRPSARCGPGRAHAWVAELGKLCNEELPRGEWWSAADASTRKRKRRDRAHVLASSFVRAQLVHGIADALRDVARALAIGPSGLYEWTPSHWSAALMERSQLEAVCRRLPDLAVVLRDTVLRKPRTRWEVAATNDLSSVLEPIPRPGSVPPEELVVRLVDGAYRPDAWLSLLLSELKEGRRGPKDTLEVALRLGLGERLAPGKDVPHDVIESMAQTLAMDASPWDLELAVRLHPLRIVAAAAALGATAPALDGDELRDARELLWQRTRGESDLSPGSVPALGLPVPVVEDLIGEIYRAMAEAPPTAAAVVVRPDTAQRLAMIRDWQFKPDETPAPVWVMSAQLGSRASETPRAQLDRPRAPVHPVFGWIAAVRREGSPVAKGVEGWSPKTNVLLAGVPLIAGTDASLDTIARSLPAPPGSWALRRLRDEHALSARYVSALEAAFQGRDPDPAEWPVATPPAGNAPHTGTSSLLSLQVEDWEGKPATRLPGEMTVRMAQLKVAPWKAHHREVVDQWPNHPNPRAVLMAVAAALPARRGDDASTALPAMTILPEVLLPHSAASLLVATCQRHGVGLLAGAYWRPVKAAAQVGGVDKRWFANEALLVLPVEREQPGSAVRVLRFRKPRPAATEIGLAGALSQKTSVKWDMLPGDRFLLFRHPRWGGFTVGICADLLDPAPWAAMRGEMLHMFFSAYNEDAELFSVITRTRAYEDYCNVVLVNHGSKGGSFAWSPRSGSAKEIARFQGEQLDVVSDVSLPVRALDEAQEGRWGQAVKEHADAWVEDHGSPKPPRFKSPPYGYRRKKGES